MAPFSPINRFKRSGAKPSSTELAIRVSRDQIQTLLVNAGKARREVVNGREFLVAPMTIIVPGVLNGSRGALLYPPSEVAREPGMWNGVPIVRNHPTENGLHVSGRTPSAMASVEMGRVFNDSWDGRKRTAEGWFDVEATKRVDPAIYNRLVNGDKIELSTGLFTDNQDRKGVWNGKRYDAIAYNYRPDHLAILPDQRGACSVEDGCGVMVNECKVKNQDDSQSGPEKKCKCHGTCDECAAKVSPEPIKNAFNPRSLESGKFKPYGSGTGKGPAHWAAQKGALLFTDEDRRLGTLAREEKAATGQNPASWVADEATWEKAKSAADKSYTEGDDAYWPAVTAIYKKMGGEVKTYNSEGGFDSDEQRQAFFGKLKSGDYKETPTEKLDRQGNGKKAPKEKKEKKSKEDKSYEKAYRKASSRFDKEHPRVIFDNARSSVMGNRRNGREEVLDWLTTNVSSLKSSAARDTLDELPDEALHELYVNSHRANEKTLVCNAVASRWPEINDVVANGGDIEAFLKEKMGGGEEEEEEVEVENGSKVKNISGDDCEGEDQDSECRAMFAAQDTNNSAGGKKMKVNCQGPARKLSFAEMLAQSGDAEAQAVWNHAVEVEREERKKLLQRITANCDRSEAKAMWDDLKGLPLPKLRRLANNVAPQVEELPQRGIFGAGHRIPDYAGASGGLVGNRGRRNDDDEGTLELPNANALLGK